MGRITKQTAMDIALHYREIEAAEALLAEVQKALTGTGSMDTRDAFGRQRGLQLGVPMGESSHRMFDVPYSLAKPIIEAHIGHHRAAIDILSAAAKTELDDVGF